jgi:hypothetical protein
MGPNPAAQGKKKCPSCAEFVQPDAKVCRFCQHSFLEEEAAEQARVEAQQASARALQQAESAARQAAEAAKPWPQRNAPGLLFVVLLIAVAGGTMWYGFSHLPQPGTSESAANPSPGDKPAIPDAVAAERSRVPKSVWDKRVAWATQHHCRFAAMSRDEIVQALGQPTSETSYDLVYKRQSSECARYSGDTCSEYKTDEQIIFLKDGYTDNHLDAGNGCRTLYGENQYLGLQVPDFRLPAANGSKRPVRAGEDAASSQSRTAEEAASWHTKENCEANGFLWKEESPTQEPGCFLK